MNIVSLMYDLNHVSLMVPPRDRCLSVGGRIDKEEAKYKYVLFLRIQSVADLRCYSTFHVFVGDTLETTLGIKDDVDC